MHRRNARRIGQLLLLLLAAIAGTAHAQDSVRLRTLELTRENQSYSPMVWTLPLPELVDPALLKGWTARQGTVARTWRYHAWTGCMLGLQECADVELIGVDTATPAVRIYTLMSDSWSDSYSYVIELARKPAKPCFETQLDLEQRTLAYRFLGLDPPAPRLAQACLRFHPERREATYKTYDVLFVPYGDQPLTKGLGGSYPHHRGVFLGWNKVRAGGRMLDFWHCREPATIRHDRFEPECEWLGHAHATLTRRLRWCDGEDLVLTERRQITDWSSWKWGQFLDYEIELLAFQPIELDGDPHHGGFQIRAAQEVHDNPDATAFVRPADSQPAGNDIWSGGRWCAIRFPLAGETQQIAMLDHPQNGDPPQWSTRAYGRFGAFRRHTLQPGIPLVLRYRLIVASDSAYTRFTPQFLDARWREWIEPPVPKILR